MSDPVGNVNVGSHPVRVSVLASNPKYLHPLSRRQITNMCVRGIFKTATKLGMGRNATWFVSSGEVLAYKLNRNASVLNRY